MPCVKTYSIYRMPTISVRQCPLQKNGLDNKCTPI
jgi:hypothetical protein